MEELNKRQVSVVRVKTVCSEFITYFACAELKDYTVSLWSFFLTLIISCLGRRGLYSLTEEKAVY